MNRIRHTKKKILVSISISCLLLLDSKSEFLSLPGKQHIYRTMICFPWFLGFLSGVWCWGIQPETYSKLIPETEALKNPAVSSLPGQYRPLESR